MIKLGKMFCIHNGVFFILSKKQQLILKMALIGVFRAIHNYKLDRKIGVVHRS